MGNDQALRIKKSVMITDHPSVRVKLNLENDEIKVKGIMGFSS